MAKKDPSLVRDSDFDDDFLSELDTLGSDLEGIDVDTQEFDSNKDREPVDKLKSVTADLRHVGKNAMGGAVAGISMRLKHEMPEVTKMIGDTLDVVSEAKRFKDDTVKDLRPTINQSKMLSRQMLKYGQDLIPTGIYDKLMKSLDVPEEDKDKRPSLEEARQIAQDQALSRISKVQMRERILTRQQEAADKIISEKISGSRHVELAGMVNDIRNQALFHTNFLRSAFTAYMRKDLELKYRHMYLAEDTLETLRITSQMMEKRLDAIRHNTSLPDSQKVRVLEIMKDNTKNKIIGSVQNSLQEYAAGIFGKIKENFITPAKDMLGTSNDAMDGLLSMMDMNAEMGEKFSAKRSILGHVGGFLGKTVGDTAMKKLLDKLPEDTKKVLINHASMGKQGLMLLMEQLRRGEVDFEGSDTLSNILDAILPERDRTGGKFTNDVYTDPNAPGAISKRFTTTVEEIIPGYLAKQVALLQEMVSGKKSEELVYDFKSRDFISSSQLNKELQTKIYGTEEERGAVLKGNATAVREALVTKGKRAQATFEEVAKEVSIFMINLSNANRWALLDVPTIKEVAETGNAESEYAEIAFRGISNRQQVASALLSLLTNSDGSINEAIKSSIELRITKAMTENSQKHRQAMHDAVFNFGYGRHMKNMISANAYGELEVNDRTRLSAYDSIGSDKVKADYEYSLDSYGNKIKEKTALEKIIESGKKSNFVKDKLSFASKNIDSGLTTLAKKFGKEDEYNQVKDYLNEQFKTLCAFLQSKKQKVKNFSSDIKNKIVAKAYDWLQKHPKYKVLTKVIFDKDGHLRDSVPPGELADLLARIPGLHRICQQIHKADNPISFVLDSIFPPSLIMVAEMTEEELSDILQSENPEEQLSNRLNNPSKFTKRTPKSRSASKVFKDDRFKHRVIPGKKRKADGGTIDEFGEPVGTISKPTLIANNNALAGEAGKETVVPLNRTRAAQEAYLQAKAYHEGKTFASGGIPDEHGKKISTKIGTFIDANVNKSIKATEKGLRHLDLQDKDANEDLRIVANRLKQTKVNTTEKLEAAQAKFEKLCKDLAELDAKAGALKVAAALTKFAMAVKKDGLWEQLPPNDRVLIKKIQACVKGKDFGLTSIRAISSKTTPIFKQAVKRYQETYVRAEEYINDTVDKAKEISNDVKLRVTDAVEKAKKSKFVTESKKVISSSVDHVKDFFGKFSDTMQPLLKNKHGSLVDIAAEQLAVQHSILDFLGGKVGKYSKQGRYAHSAETGDGAKKPVYENFWHEASDRIGRTVKKVAWDMPLSLTEKTLRNSYDSARGFLTNKSTSVYRKPGAGQQFSKEFLLISAEDFSKGVFFDPEGKKRVRSVMDINKPVYDATGKMLISKSDLEQGLVDENQKPIRSAGGLIGRLAHNTTAGALSLTGKTVSKTFDVVKNSHLITKTFDAAAMPFHIAHAALQKWVDIYRPGQKEPLVTARDLRFGRLRFADGGIIKDAYSINRPVIWLDTDDNGDKRGNLAITWDDLDAGLITSNGKPLAGASNQIGSLARRAVGLIGSGANLLFKGTTGILGLGRKIVVGAVRSVFGKTDPFVDVYVPDDKGEIKIGEPVLTGGNIKLGRYVYANGRRVTSAYGIDRAVLDAETGKTLITEADIQRGLVDIRRNKLSKFAGKSVAGKVVSGISSLTGWGLKTAWKGIKSLGRGISKGANFLTKGIFDKGVDIVSYMHGALNDILGTVFQKDNVRRQDLMEIVGARLDNIYKLLNVRMPGKALNDTDGDGIRDGSYQDAEKKKEKRAATKAQKKGRAAAALAAAGAAGSKDRNTEEKDGGGLFDGAADAKAAWDTFKDSKIGKGLGKAGRWMKGKLGAGAKFLGRGAATAASTGISALASTGIGTAVSGAASSLLASGSTLLASAATGAGALLGTATSAIASGAAATGTAIAGLASNPVGWAIAAGLLAYGGYKLASWAFSESDADKEWRKLRYEYYGADPAKHEKIISSLEKRTLKTIDKEEPGLSKEELEEFAIDFGLVDKGFLGIGGNDAAGNKERMDYFATWYSARFSPVFAAYVERIRSATNTGRGDKLKPSDIKADRAEYAHKYFIRQAKEIVDQGNTKNLIPTEEGFKKYKQSEEEAKKKDEKPDAATAAKTAAGVGALATPKTDTDADKKEAKSKTQEEIDKATTVSKNAKPNTVIPGTKDGEKPSFTSVVGDALKWATSAGILASAGYKIFTWMFGDSTEVLLWKTLKHQYYGTSEDKHKSALKKLEEHVLRIVAGSESEMKPADLEEHAENFGLIDRGVKIGVVIGPRVGGDDNSTIKSRMEYFTSWYALRFRPMYQTYLNIVAAYTGSKLGDKPNPDDIPEDKRKQAQDAFRKEGDMLLSRNPEVKDLVPSLDGFIDYLKKKQKEEELKKTKTGDNKQTSTKTASEDSILATIGAATAAKNTTTDNDQDKADTAKRKTLADAKLQADLEASKKIAGDHKDIDPRKHSGNAAAVAARGTVFAATPDMKVNASPLQLAVGAAGGASNYANQQSSGTTPQVNTEALKAANIPDGGSGDLGSYMKKFESGDEGTSNISWDSTGGTSYGTYQFAAKKGGLQAFLDWANKSGGEFGKKLVTAMGSAGKLETGSTKGAAPDVWRQFAKVEGNPLGKLEQNFTYEKVYKVALAGINNPKAKALIMGDRGLQEALWSTAVGHGIGGAPSLFMKVYKDGMTAEEWITAIYKERPTRYQSSTPRIQASMAKRYARELPIMLGLSKAKGQSQDQNAQGQGAAGTSGSGGDGGGEMSPNTLATAGAGGLTGTPATDKMQEGFAGAMNNEGGDGKNGWKRPTDSPVITSPFGPRNVPGGSKDHKGIDLRARMGEPIYAAKDGTVTFAGGSYNAVELKHAGDEGSKYLHLSKINVRAGQQVKEGEVIGQSGGTGPNGPSQYPAHLHFEILKGGKPVDPEPFMKSAGISLNRKGEKGNESMAPESDADATPETGNEQSAAGLKEQEAKAGNPDAKTSDTGTGSTTGTDQSQGADIAQKSADVAKTGIAQTLNTSYGNSGTSDTGSTSGGASSSGGGSSLPSPPSNAPANTTSDNTGVPQVQTNTPTQTGQIGPDITANAQLEQLKMIVSILSGIREDNKGYFGGNGSPKDSSTSEPVSSNSSSGETTQPAPGIETGTVTTAVQQAFAPGSPTLAAIQAAIAGATSNPQQPGQNQTTPPGVDRSTMRTPLNTSKKGSSAFQL